MKPELDELIAEIDNRDNWLQYMQDDPRLAGEALLRAFDLLADQIAAEKAAQPCTDCGILVSMKHLQCRKCFFETKDRNSLSALETERV